MAYTTRGSLLSAVRRGDEIGWSEFYQLYKPLILLIGTDLHLSPTEREELVQQVMLSFFNTSKTFVYDRSKGRFRDYLKQTIQHKACDIMRNRQDHTVSVESESASIENLPAETEDRWKREWQELMLNRAFEILKRSFDPTTLQSYDLFVRQGLPAREVAKLLEIKTNAVYQHRARVEEKLREIVRELDD